MDNRPPEIVHGIGLFNERRWFEAHEVWEDFWHRIEGPDRPFVQSLIQIAVALEHARRGNQKGARRTLGRAARRLAEAPPCRYGIAIGRLHAQAERAVEAGDDPPTV